MRKIFISFLSFCLLLFAFLNCQESTAVNDESDKITLPSYWAKRLGGTGSDIGLSITTDSNGSVIVSGRAEGNADLNGDGIISSDLPETASAISSGDDIIMSKFNSAGTHQWSIRLGGSDNDYGSSVAVDTNNNVVITGFINGNADLNGDGDKTDTTDGTGNLSGELSTGYGIYDIFIAKFDSSGVYQWSRRLGGIGALGDFGNGITTDVDGNVIVIGNVHGNADLNGDGDSSDGGAETSTINYDITDIIISKFSSSGVYQWSKRLGGLAGDKGYGITSDSNNNIIVTGYVNGNADLNGNGNSTDGGAESNSGYGAEDIFISRFNSTGTCQWYERLGGTDVGSGESGYFIKADTVGNIVIVGVVRGNADLNGDGDSNDLTDDSLSLSGEIASGNYNSNDIFVVKFQEIDIDNNYIYQWSRRLGGSSTDIGYGIAIDTFNNSVIITGNVSGDSDLNGDADSLDIGGESASGYGSNDIFISKFTSGGTFLWSKRAGGSSGDIGYSITTDNGRNNFISGLVFGNVDLNADGDKSDGTAESGSYGGNDIFITKFNSDGIAQ